MLQKDFSCGSLNDLVEQYHRLVRSSSANSEERKEAATIYERILQFLTNHSDKEINLNKVSPQTLHFIQMRGLQLHTKRAGKTRYRKTRRKKNAMKR